MRDRTKQLGPEAAVAQVLKRLYPQNPDVVLGREARVIVDALTKAGWRLLDPGDATATPPALISTSPNGGAMPKVSMSAFERNQLARMERLLADSLRRDRAKPSRRSTTDDGVVVVNVSGLSVGLAHAIESLTGEQDALNRVGAERGRQ